MIGLVVGSLTRSKKVYITNDETVAGSNHGDFAFIRLIETFVLQFELNIKSIIRGITQRLAGNNFYGMLILLVSFKLIVLVL